MQQNVLLHLLELQKQVHEKSRKQVPMVCVINYKLVSNYKILLLLLFPFSQKMKLKCLVTWIWLLTLPTTLLMVWLLVHHILLAKVLVSSQQLPFCCMRYLMKSAILLYWSSLAATGGRYTKAKTTFYVENFTFSFCCIYQLQHLSEYPQILQIISVLLTP